MESELRLLIYGYLVGVLHELLAKLASLLGHGGTEHHHLFLLRSLHEDLLDILTHVKLLKALVALIEDKLCQFLQLQIFVTAQCKNATRRADQNLWTTVFQHLLVFVNRHATIHDRGFHISEKLCEAFEFVFDLVRELARMADDKHLHRLLGCIHLLQTCEHEDSSLAHSRFCLAQNVRAKNRLWNASVLYFRWMFKTAIHSSPKQLGL
mmetsp:Transcript_93969/g.148520  ORF Transcript_93969/g.148520 Transcript_93969/m.148520 type:complete len:209 (+) Transcript_93969:627-1253(+)